MNFSFLPHAFLPWICRPDASKTTSRLQHASRITSWICTRELAHPLPFLSRHLQFICSAEISKYDERTANKIQLLVLYHWHELLSSESCGFTGPFSSRSHCNIM